MAAAFGSGRASAGGNEMEALRPYDVALCMLLRSYLCPLDESEPSPLSPLHALLGEALLREIRRRDEVAHPSLLGLLRNVQDHICPSGEELSAEAEYFAAVKASLGQRLAALESPDDLVAFFASLADSLITSCTSAPDAEGEEQGADANSAMGLYLRMCYAQYTAAPFEAVCQLLTAVQQYFDAAVAVLQGQAEPQPSQPSLKPAADLQRFLNSQLASLGQRVGRAPQADIERPLAELEAAAPHLAKTYLARHLSSLHHRDFAASLDYLHRFFDHTVDARPAPAPPAAAGQAPQDAAAAARERGRMQSAALSLGSMHAQFGHIEEAMQALNETVRIAQQSSDDACLAHALASLCQILDATTPGTITSVTQAPRSSPAARHYSQLNQLLRRCLRRSEELQLPHLVAFSRLALARFELLHPQQPTAATDARAAAGGSDANGSSSSSSSSEPPCGSSLAVASAARDAAHLHLATSLAAAAPATPAPGAGTASARVLRGVGDLFTSSAALLGPSMQGTQASSAAEVERLAGSAHLLQAACWELRGSRQLSQAHSLIALDTFGDVARAEDQCAALAQLATSVAAAHGYQAAEQLLAAADERFPQAQSPVLRAARLAVAHDRALRRRELHAAMDIATQMAALASPTDSTDITFRLEAEERIARTLLAAGRCEEAAQAAQTLFAVATATGQPLHSTRLLLLLGRVHHEAGAPLAALPYALSCVVHARQLHADMLAAEAAVLVAQLWGDMGAQHAQRAQQELEAVLPTILAHAGLELQARAQTALAEAVMARHDSPASLQQDADWVLGLLEEGERQYRQLEDRRRAAHCAYLRALVQDALGQVAQRNADAASHGALLQPALD